MNAYNFACVSVCVRHLKSSWPLTLGESTWILVCACVSMLIHWLIHDATTLPTDRRQLKTLINLQSEKLFAKQRNLHKGITTPNFLPHIAGYAQGNLFDRWKSPRKLIPKASISLNPQKKDWASILSILTHWQLNVDLLTNGTLT